MTKLSDFKPGTLYRNYDGDYLIFIKTNTESDSRYNQMFYNLKHSFFIEITKHEVQDFLTEIEE